MKTLRIVVVAALTIGLVAFWLRKADLPTMGRELAHASPAWIAVVVIASLTHCVVRTWRWKLLLGPDGAGDATFADLLGFVMMGYAVTFVIPGRAGEVVRPALLWRRGGVPFGHALGSVLLERILDLAVIGGFLALFVLLEPDRSPPLVRRAVVALVAGAVAALTALVLLARRHRALADRLVEQASNRIPQRFRDTARSFAGSLLDGVRTAFAAHGAPLIVASSVLTWLPILAGSMAGLLAIHLHPPWTAPLALVPLTALGIAVPTPGGVGTFHAVASWTLTTLFGVADSPAKAAAVVTHAASVLPVIAAGFYAAWREGLSLGSLRREALAAKSAEAAAP